MYFKQQQQKKKNQLVTFDCVTDLGMDDEGDDDPVPLPNVNAAILKKVRGHKMPLTTPAFTPSD